MQRRIKQLFPIQQINMGGHMVDQPIPNAEVQQIDPFLLIHHWTTALPGGNTQSEVGVAPHPHRGFSPVTFIYKGEINHQDSLGNNETVNDGGTQWMFAGSGIMHSERPSPRMAENGGDQEFIQLWINAPASKKMTPAYYQAIHEKDTPTISGDGFSTQVVSGNYENVKGAIEYMIPLILLRTTLLKGALKTFTLPEEHNVILYSLDGNIRVDDEVIAPQDLVWFESEKGSIDIQADQDARFIILSGEPINEPLKVYGPFVMNTQREIMTALADATDGKMGTLIEQL